MDKSK
jgi:tRNA A-37 threonylcarbamoyl transferase component Bud32